MKWEPFSGSKAAFGGRITPTPYRTHASRDSLSSSRVLQGSGQDEAAGEEGLFPLFHHVHQHFPL